MRRSSVVVISVWLFACADSDLFGREGQPRVSNDAGGMAGSPGSGSGSASDSDSDSGPKPKENDGGAGGAPGTRVSSSVASTGAGGAPPEREPNDDD